MYDLTMMFAYKYPLADENLEDLQREFLTYDTDLMVTYVGLSDEGESQYMVTIDQEGLEKRVHSVVEFVLNKLSDFA